VRECWKEIWHILQPLIDTPFKGGPATWNDDILLEIGRYGTLEESHFTIAYSPVPDETAENGIGGVVATVTEITEKVVSERHVKALRDLSAASLEAKTAEEACRVATETLAGYALDVPFALIYLLEPDGTTASLAGTAGIEPGTPMAPSVISLARDADEGAPWPLDALAAETTLVVEDLEKRFGSAVPVGPWGDRPSTAVVLPLRSNAARGVFGFFVAGVSTRLRLDDRYRGFYDLAAGQITTAINNARAYEAERERAEALAELDRAKTLFFSNVSHELRTPLTLMLGPLEDVLASEELHGETQQHVETAYRNAGRLLRLVNTLLDFSRIEAGRIDAAYEKTDIASLTIDLASTFRSAIERAGLRFTVDCATPSQDVYVDRDMWEKIVLNLLTNALKFTFEGSISVSLIDRGSSIELAIADTGTGIAQDELSRIFERFHRVREARSRTYEGTGIGLSLVRELARLHGGDVTVESKEGVGSTFLVRIPTGRAHLPADRVGVARMLTSTAVGVAPYVNEALGWLGIDAASTAAMSNDDGMASGNASPDAAWVLVVDDNADMRDYIQRLLQGRWNVITAPDGRAALDIVLNQPVDLVLTDIMMPRMDGIELMRAIRGNHAKAMTPVILLSARAGEEPRVEGLEAGADDYLIKPFSARELIARVQTHLALAAAHREREQLKDQFLSLVSHELRTPLSTIYGSSRLLKDRFEKIPESDRRDLLSDVVSESDRLNRTIENLLLLTRLDARGLDLEPIAIPHLIEQFIEEFRARHGERVLNVHLEPDLPLVGGNDTYIELVLDNLLSNAAKYSSPETPIDLIVSGSGSVEIRVLDRGIGLQPDEIANLFTPFYRTPAAAQKASGVGVGLAVCKRVIEAQGGTLWAKSRDGGGSEFGFSLPALVGVPSDAA
jgi:signal transduction histidine kinase